MDASLLLLVAIGALLLAVLMAAAFAPRGAH